MPIQRRKLGRHLGVGLVVAGLLLTAADIGVAFFQRWQAGRLLTLIQQTKVGQTSEAEFQREAKRLLRYTGLRGEFDHQGSAVRLAYSIDNWAFLFRISLSSEAQAMEHRTFPYWQVVEMDVSFDQGMVMEKHALFFTPGVGHPEFGVVIDESVCGFGVEGGSVPQGCPQHIAYRRIWNDAAWTRIRISDDTEVSDADRKTDWNINRDCMTKFGGCRDAREILPNVRIVPSPDHQN